MASTADDEYVQLTIPEAFIYKCPPRASASGYRAAEMTEQVAIVRVVVATKGHDVLLRLFRADTDKLFAMCPLRRGGPPGLEPVTDSSRYFCLRLENEKGNHAFVGLGFNRREDAFDLKSSIADAQKQAEAELAGAGAGIDLGIGELGSDFSLKKGEALTIKIGGSAGGAKVAPASKPTAAGSVGGFKLRAPGAALASPAGSGNGSGGGDLLGLDGAIGRLSLAGAPAKAKAVAPAAAAAPAVESAAEQAWEAF